MICLHCDGWACSRCRPPHEVAASTGGEQGLSQEELEIVALRNRVLELETERDEAKRLHSVLHEVASESSHMHTLLLHEHGCAVDSIRAALKRVAELEAELDASRHRSSTLAMLLAEARRWVPDAALLARIKEALR